MNDLRDFYTKGAWAGFEERFAQQNNFFPWYSTVNTPLRQQPERIIHARILASNFILPSRLDQFPPESGETIATLPPAIARGKLGKSNWIANLGSHDSSLDNLTSALKLSKPQ